MSRRQLVKLLFETNEHSWHGFQTVQAPDGRELSRKSFAIYMYTKDRPAEEIVPKHWTIYVLPGPPKHFQAGYTLSAEDVPELKLALKECNAFLKVMRMAHRCEHCPKTVQRAGGTPKMTRNEAERVMSSASRANLSKVLG